MSSISDMGMNKTGAGLHPKQAKDMAEAAQKAQVPPGDERGIATVRGEYTRDAGVVGTMPPPSSVKGAAKTAGQMLTGRKATVLLDKIGERLAFERTGSRLYAAAITKISTLGWGDGVGIDAGRLDQILAEEMEHAALCADAIEKLGADPTAETPCADVVGVMSTGVAKVITDPRTSISQCLEALLTLELVDNASWELLIDLAEEFNQGKLASEFRRALQEEESHLVTIKGWLADAMRQEAHGNDATA